MEAYEKVVRKIYLKQETIFNQLVDEVLAELAIEQDVFIKS